MSQPLVLSVICRADASALLICVYEDDLARDSEYVTERLSLYRNHALFRYVNANCVYPHGEFTLVARTLIIG